MNLCKATPGQSHPPRVIMLSHTSEPARIVAAVEAGSHVWVRKDESVDHLFRVIRGVAAGETWIPPAELGQVLTFLLRQRDERADRERLLAQLTRREREVLTCIAEGFSRTQVAEHLDLQVNTVRTHIQNIMSKLHVHSALDEALAGAGLAPQEEAGIRTSAHDRITQVSYSE